MKESAELFHPEQGEGGFIEQSAEQGIRDAKEFFSATGLPLDEEGLISEDLTAEQVEQLRKWNESTRTKDGGLMPSEQDFYRKVFLAVSLWRQREDGRINYLFGRGVGVELALRGQVLGREKSPVSLPYRSHSDFDLYGVDYRAGAGGEKLDDKPIYSDSFRQVFGSQEFFPLTLTKGLKNLPPDLLHRMAERVQLGEIEVLIPKLEILFLDKLIRPEGTPRGEGSDAELLARQYSLDGTLLHQYLDNFEVAPQRQRIESGIEKRVADQIDGIRRIFEMLKEESEQKGKATGPLEDLNTRMENLKGTGVKAHFGGIEADAWIEIEPDQIDGEGNIIDRNLLKQIQGRIEQLAHQEIENIQNLHQKIDEVLSLDK